MTESTSNDQTDAACVDSHLESARKLAQKNVADLGRSATAWIVENPELSLGIALALGVGIGLAVKRR